jgi:hypothetical protein
MGARGYGDGFNAGMVIGLPPILNFAKEPLRTKVLEEVFNGEKVSTCHVIIYGLKAAVTWRPVAIRAGYKERNAHDQGHLARYLRSIRRV